MISRRLMIVLTDTRFPYIYFNIYFILDMSVKLMAIDIYFALLIHVVSTTCITKESRGNGG